MCGLLRAGRQPFRSWFLRTESGKGSGVITRTSRTVFGIALCAATLSACTVGPDYAVPTQAVINGSAAKGSFLTSKDQASLAVAPVPEGWWRLYADERLNTLVQAAMAANTDLRMAAANLERSRALLREAKSAQEPGGGLNG